MQYRETVRMLQLRGYEYSSAIGICFIASSSVYVRTL